MIFFLIFISACDSENNEQKPPKTPPTSVQTINNSTGFYLLQKTNLEKEGNIILSPTSALFALLMTYNGTSGETKAEIEEALQIKNIPLEEINKHSTLLMQQLERENTNLTLQLANSLWLNDQYIFKKNYEQTVSNVFNAGIQAIDVKDPHVAKQINLWVEEQTKGKISQLIDGTIDENLLAYIINTMYFKGTWKYEFNESLTDNDLFFTDPTTEIDHPFMTLEAKLHYMENDGFQAVKLPYAEEEFSMHILLPKEHTTLTHLIEELNENQWKEIKEAYSEKNGKLQLPSFTLEDENILNTAFQQLGMESIFSGADFSNMIEGESNLYVDEIKQKTFIEINEKGTEAAAATSVGIMLTSAPIEDDSFQMKVNRPFLLIIEEETTETIVFLGAIYSPKSFDDL